MDGEVSATDALKARLRATFVESGKIPERVTLTRKEYCEVVDESGGRAIYELTGDGGQTLLFPSYGGTVRVDWER